MLRCLLVEMDPSIFIRPDLLANYDGLLYIVVTVIVQSQDDQSVICLLTAGSSPQSLQSLQSGSPHFCGLLLSQFPSNTSRGARFLLLKSDHGLCHVFRLESRQLVYAQCWSALYALQESTGSQAEMCNRKIWCTHPICYMK